MQKDIQLIEFLNKISRVNEPLSLTFSDFFPLESIIDYRTITYDEKSTIIEYTDYLKKTTKRVIINFNTYKNYSFETHQKIIELIRSQFDKKDVLIELGVVSNDNQIETTIDIVLYK